MGAINRDRQVRKKVHAVDHFRDVPGIQLTSSLEQANFCVNEGRLDPIISCIFSSMSTGASAW
jgi:hypothetical protein